MTRPNIDPASLVSGMEGWDAVLRDIVAALVSTPLPVPRYAEVAALPAAGSYDGCLACVEDTGELYFSKGGSWELVIRP